MKSASLTVRISIFLIPAVIANLLTPPATLAGQNPQPDPSTTLWYDKPASDWQTQALPIGSGRLGAMIFGKVGRQRISLNEESVWSGSRVNWNRENAAKNLPKIRQLLLAGKNADAEELVNKTFTCTGGGSRGGARGPWGCYQELGNLNITWHSDIESIPLNKWKYKMLTTPGITDHRKQWRKIQQLVDEYVKPNVDESQWTDYIITDGKPVKGHRKFSNNERAVMRHHLTLTKDNLPDYGVLRVGPRARQGRVYVNGHEVANLPGWRASAHDKFQQDISTLLKPGENVIAVYCTQYRRRGEMPLYISLDPSEKTQKYRRSLDLANAVSTVEYTKDGVTYTRKAFASAPDEVMVFNFKADQPGKISFTAQLNRQASFETVPDGSAGLLMTGNTQSGQQGVDGMKFVARLRAIPTGGKVSVKGNTLYVDSADEVTLLIAAATNYLGFAGRHTPNPIQATAADIAKAQNKSYKQLRSAHIAEYKSYFDRASITLSDNNAESQKTAALPTDQRITALAGGASDPALAALYFNFGRCLLISSSRPGDMPANLQGIWAQGIQTPWNCDYHIDINVQMNYWPAEVTGLGDCHTPLFKLIESLQKPGAKTAKEYYNADGWVAHVITNVWGFTAPGEQAGWGATATGSPWLCDHLWEHYDYNRDKDFLKWAYPIMKGSAEFFLDMLITDPKTGWLVTAPSNSPENTFETPDGQRARVCMGPTMDMQILRELFTNCIESAKILGIDEDFRKRLKPDRQTRPDTGMAERLQGSRTPPPPRIAPLRPAPPRRDHPRKHSRTGKGSTRNPRKKRRPQHRLVNGMESKLLGKTPRRQSRTRALKNAHHPRRQKSLLPPPALPDRRQLRRHRRRRRNAPAKPQRHNPPVARTPRRMAKRQSERPPRKRRLYSRLRMEKRKSHQLPHHFETAVKCKSQSKRKNQNSQNWHPEPRVLKLLISDKINLWKHYQLQICINFSVFQ